MVVVVDEGETRAAEGAIVALTNNRVAELLLEKLSALERAEPDPGVPDRE